MYKKINHEKTVEKINSIIEFEGELIDEEYNIYYWELSEETGVKMAYYLSTKGTVIEKSSYSTKYVWVAYDGGYLNRTFSSSSGNCTFASGMIK